MSKLKEFLSRAKKNKEGDVNPLVLQINELIDSLEKKSLELNNSEEKYRTLFEESMDAIWSTQLNGIIVEANEAAGKLLDFPRNELIGKNILEFYSNPLDRPKFQNKIHEEGSVKEYPLTFKNRKGDEIQCLITFSARRNNNGNIMGYQGIVHNITDRILYEKRLVNLNETLRVLNKILRHDIANNLTVISMSLEMLETNDKPLKEKAQRSISKCTQLIEDIRDLEIAIESGKDVEIHNLREVVDSVIENYSETKFTISGNCNVYADDAIFSVFDNIIRNAIVHGKSDVIDISIKEEDSHYEVRISDNGIGIPNEIKDKIFEEGESFGSTRGSGLGLYIVKKVVERHGGDIAVEDSEPKGAAFTIKFKKS